MMLYNVVSEKDLKLRQVSFNSISACTQSHTKNPLSHCWSIKYLYTILCVGSQVNWIEGLRLLDHMVG